MSPQNNQTVEEVIGQDESQVETTKSFEAELRTHLGLISKAVELSEPRFTYRVLRCLTAAKRRLQVKDGGSEVDLKIVIESALTANSKIRELLVSIINSISNTTRGSSAMQIDPLNHSAQQKPSISLNPKKESLSLPDPSAQAEHETYLSLLVLVMLISRGESNQMTFELSHRLVTDYLPHQNRRSLDPLAAKIWFYHSRLAELLEQSGTRPGLWAGLRSQLMSAYRTARLRRDEDSEATLLNLIVRNLLAHDLWEQADRLVSKTEFPDFGKTEASVGAGGMVPTGQVARWLYYLGRIRTIQLNYTEAHTHLQQAIRRASRPQVAPGFWQSTHKLYVVVELLMGDIPDRALFRGPVLKKCLQPYFEIVQAVRVGDITRFEEALNIHSRRFLADQTYTLILRLRHNVIKTALRTISLAYSRIRLNDVSLKLRLDSEEDAEYVVAKAIRDGVIEARLDRIGGWMVSKEVNDIYSTNEPQDAFHQRISFCLKLHNESVKAMRFPLNAHRKELASAEAARERERELASEILTGDSPDGDEDGDLGDAF
ncbi:26S proteasome non-ATPase regulatory subunit 3 [Phakopsora pachyrhizi]|uniref:26S proteasome regulatory subunit RPN3 n=1 Tax=Phakopsora pachyrhizi TaxID=170000 RepID=A0AAV0AEZ5_PHAPC|nr:26S proteasome non-ATPase regulatory subunit 3 [Phakopsora pachyrhizi]CAH7665792.1 26S proteasome non-ATPase regulatory subunit 3 [Phakopsora pachyrhizi]